MRALNFVTSARITGWDTMVRELRTDCFSTAQRNAQQFWIFIIIKKNIFIHI